MRGGMRMRGDFRCDSIIIRSALRIMSIRLSIGACVIRRWLLASGPTLIVVHSSLAIESQMARVEDIAEHL